MLSLDKDYLSLKPYLEAECARRKLAFDFTELNPSGFGDAMWVGANGIHNVEIKQSSEVLSDIDHLINQIRNQSASSDWLWLFVYGEMEPADGGLASYSLKLVAEDTKYNLRTQQEYEHTKSYKRHLHRVNYAGHRKILWRFREVGVQVIEVRDLPELAFELCTLYECSQSEGSTFSRLIVEKIRISQYPPEKERFMRQVMGLGAGYAEEAAEALATFMEGRNEELTMANLCWAFQIDALDGLAAAPFRSYRDGGRKQTIGPVRVAALKAALGC